MPACCSRRATAASRRDRSPRSTSASARATTLRPSRPTMPACASSPTVRPSRGARRSHGRDVLRRSTPPGEERPQADGIATNVPGVAALVLTADCLPVALSAPGAVAMVHAGWRGLASGVLAEGVAALRDVGATGPVVAAIGPGAGGCCYEVGDEVRAAFADVPEAAHGRNVDLKAVAAGQAARRGRRGDPRRRSVHDVRRALLLASSRSRHDRPSGRRRVADLATRARADRRGGRARGTGSAATWRSWRRRSTSRSRASARSSRRASRESARTAHRISRPSTPSTAIASRGTSSATCRAARSRQILPLVAADPLRRQRLRAGSARAPPGARAAGVRDPRRGQRRPGGGQERHRPRRAGRVPRALPRSRRWA